MKEQKTYIFLDVWWWYHPRTSSIFICLIMLFSRITCVKVYCVCHCYRVYIICIIRAAALLSLTTCEIMGVALCWAKCAQLIAAWANARGRNLWIIVIGIYNNIIYTFGAYTRYHPTAASLTNKLSTMPTWKAPKLLQLTLCVSSLLSILFYLRVFVTRLHARIVTETNLNVLLLLMREIYNIQNFEPLYINTYRALL